MYTSAANTAGRLPSHRADNAAISRATKIAATSDAAAITQSAAVAELDTASRRATSAPP